MKINIMEFSTTTNENVSHIKISKTQLSYVGVIDEQISYYNIFLSSSIVKSSYFLMTLLKLTLEAQSYFVTS
jgi:hypothetical protein